MILVSVIIPCYNVELYINECLNSVYSQSYKDLEVIAIDNNSSDNTLNILEKYRSANDVNLLILIENNQGAPAARNKGLKLASGKWIQFLDADDILRPDKISHQIELISKSPSTINFVAGAFYKQKVSAEKALLLPSKDLLKGLFSTQLGITSANLWNREYLDSAGGWKNSLKSSQEYDLMFRLLKCNSQVIIDETPLTIVRERKTGQISQRNPVEKWKQYIDLRYSILKYIQEHRQEYFEQEAAWYYQALIENLVTLAKYDYLYANKIHSIAIPKKFRVVPSGGISNVYVKIHNELGYAIANRLIYFKNKWFRLSFRIIIKQSF